MTSTLTVDLEKVIAAIDAAHGLAHDLDSLATELHTLITDGVAVAQTVRSDLAPVEHLGAEVYDALVALGRDGFNEALGAIRGILGSKTPAPAAVAPTVPLAPTVAPPTSTPAPAAPVAGEQTPPPAEPAPVTGTDTAAEGVPDAAPGVQH